MHLNVLDTGIPSEHFVCLQDVFNSANFSTLLFFFFFFLRLIWSGDVGERRISVVYFNVDLNNVRQRRNNVVIFNLDWRNVEQRRNNGVNMAI